jgi:hypothetical protein
MNFKADINGKTEAHFESSYKQNDNVVTVTNTESYHAINYPLNIFDSYKAVINAAADFNKITLILSKQ